jgi:hypothetical protein
VAGDLRARTVANAAKGSRPVSLVDSAVRSAALPAPPAQGQLAARGRSDRRPYAWLPVDDLRNMLTARLVGLTALAFSALCLLSDVIGAIQGGFSDGQLSLTLVAEAAVPVFVLGLYMVHIRAARWLSPALDAADLGQQPSPTG